jgi:hypothetical protein
MSHVSQRAFRLLVGQHAQKGRLLKSHSQSLLQSLIEDGFAGGVAEVAKDDSVSFGGVGPVQFMKIRTPGNNHREDHRDQRKALTQSTPTSGLSL